MENTTDTNIKVTEPTYIIVNIFGSIFYLIIIALFSLEWKSLTLHSCTVLSYIVSQFFAYIFGTCGGYFMVYHRKEFLLSISCSAIGLLTHYFILNSFLWLSVINVDIWLSFRYLQRPIDKNPKRRYICYFISCMIVSTTIVSTGLILQNFDNKQIIKPNYGKRSCFLEKTALLPYLYGPGSALLLLNVVFFIMTCVNLWKYKNETKMVANAKHRESALMFVKLFAIMGVPMFLAKLPNLLNINWLRELTKLVYALQALALLLLFVIKHFSVVRAVSHKIFNLLRFK